MGHASLLRCRVAAVKIKWPAPAFLLWSGSLRASRARMRKQWTVAIVQVKKAGGNKTTRLSRPADGVGRWWPRGLANGMKLERILWAWLQHTMVHSLNQHGSGCGARLYFFDSVYLIVIII